MRGGMIDPAFPRGRLDGKNESRRRSEHRLRPMPTANASPEKRSHNLAHGGDDRSRNVEILQEQREPWKIDAAQVCIAADQQPGAT